MHNKNAKALKTFSHFTTFCIPLRPVLIVKLKNCILNGSVLVKCIRYAYIRVLRVKISQKWHFVFGFRF